MPAWKNNSYAVDIVYYIASDKNQECTNGIKILMEAENLCSNSVTYQVKICFQKQEKKYTSNYLNEKMKLIFLTFLLKDQCNAEKHADGIIVSLI